YAGTLAAMASSAIAPLIVLSIAGAAANAAYQLTWTIAYSIHFIGRSMGSALVAEGAATPRRLVALTAQARVHTMVILGGSAVAVVVFAPWIMAILGPSYVETGTAILRVLALPCLPWGAVTLFLFVQRARGRTLAVALAEF